MKYSPYIIEYLKELLALLPRVAGEKSPLVPKIKALINYHEGDPNHYMYNEILEPNEKGARRFGLKTKLYLLERRQIVIDDNMLHLVVPSGIVPLNKELAIEYLMATFDLNHKDVQQLIDQLGAIRSFRHYISDEGVLTYPTIPKSFNRNVVMFKDCAINLQTLEQIEIKLDTIPYLKFNVEFNNPNTYSINLIKDLLLFIADYNKDSYRRLIKIIAYTYTHKRLDKLMMLLGTGRNGKGLLLNMINVYSLGRSFQISSMRDVAKSSGTSKEGVLLDLITSNTTLVEEETVFNMPLFNEYYKSLVTGGAKTGRKIGGDAQTLKNHSVFFVASNYFDFADVKSNDFAFLDRILFTDFNNKFINHGTHQDTDRLVSKLMDYNNTHLSFINLLHVIIDELGGQKRLDEIENISSANIKHNLLRNKKVQINEICKILSENTTTFEPNKPNNIRVSKVSGLVDLTTKEIKELVKDCTHIDIVNTHNVNYLSFDNEFMKTKILKTATIEDYSFHQNLNIEKIHKITQKQIRVTEMMYKLNIENIEKEDMTDYLNIHEEFELELVDDQPFVTSLKDPLNDVIEDKPTNEMPTEEKDEVIPPKKTLKDILRESIEKDREKELQKSFDYLDNLLEECNQNKAKTEDTNDNYKVSVFRQPHYLKNGVDYRTEYTSDIASVTSPPQYKKNELVKIFPYGLETRGGEIKPSNLIALDFDNKENGNDFEAIISVFKKLNYKCYLQQSYSSMTKEYPYVKFHVIIECNRTVHQHGYNDIVNYICSKLPYIRDDRFKYKTMMNVSKHKWVVLHGDYLDIGDVKLPPLKDTKQPLLENGLAVVQDRSEYKTLEDYLINSPHQTAETFLQIIHNNAYKIGCRDDTIYQIVCYLNDSWENYKMKQSVYDEGFKTLYQIAFKDDTPNDKHILLNKIVENKIH